MAADLAIEVLQGVCSRFPDSRLDERRREANIASHRFEVTISGEDLGGGRVLFRHEFPIMRFTTSPGFKHLAVYSAEGSFKNVDSLVIDEGILRNHCAVEANEARKTFAQDVLIYATAASTYTGSRRWPMFSQKLSEWMPAELLNTAPLHGDAPESEREFAVRLNDLIPDREAPGWPDSAIAEARSTLENAGVAVQDADGGISAAIPIDPQLMKMFGQESEAGIIELAVSPSAEGSVLEWKLQLPYFPKDASRGDVLPITLNQLEWELEQHEMLGSWTIEPMNPQAIPYFRLGLPMRLYEAGCVGHLTQGMLERVGWVRQWMAPSAGFQDLFDHLARGPFSD